VLDTIRIKCISIAVQAGLQTAGEGANAREIEHAVLFVGGAKLGGSVMGAIERAARTEAALRMYCW
jgi:hypothetical protein